MHRANDGHLAPTNGEPAMNDVFDRQAPAIPIDHVREQFHNLHEFVAVARARLDRNVWDYLIGGAETETTVRRNRLALDLLAFRPRVLRDVNGTDTRPHVPRPQDRDAGRARSRSAVSSASTPSACAAVADAAGTFGCPMFQSSVAEPDIEDTGKVVPNGLKIFQLYVRGDQAWVEAVFDRAVKAGFGALCLTVDAPTTAGASAHFQALSRCLGARPGRLAPPEGARLGPGRQGQEEATTAAHPQGRRDRRGRQARGRARR